MNTETIYLKCENDNFKGIAAITTSPANNATGWKSKALISAIDETEEIAREYETEEMASKDPDHVRRTYLLNGETLITEQEYNEKRAKILEFKLQYSGL